MTRKFLFLFGLVVLIGGGPRLWAPSNQALSLPTTHLSAPKEPAGIITPKEPALISAPKEPAGLIIPVAGVRASQLRDTYSEARGEGRTHNALDIMAARGTPVVAAAEGEIARLFYSERGGITVYQWSADRQYIYYYAHLERYADGLAAGRKVRQGETIGYVGDTGNAGAGNYHLHFSIWLVTDPKRYWEGVNINPYPLLRNGM